MDKGLVVRAASLLMIVQIISRVFGLFRDMAMQNMYGMGFATDAFNAAFSIPDFIYNIIIGGAISAAFIPVFSAYLARDNALAAWRTSSIFTSWVMVLMTVFLSLGFVFTEQILSIIVQFEPDKMALTVVLTRITLIQAMFFALSAIATGILQAQQHFTWPAIGILLYNLSVLAFGVILAKPIEAIRPGYGVAAFSVGVVIGAVLTLLVQLPTLKKFNYQFRFSLNIHDSGFRQMVKLLIPVMISLSVAQINLMVSQYLASGLEDGILTATKNAIKIMQLPIGVFAISIAVAVFPTMTKQAALGEQQEMKRSMTTGINTILYVLLPATVGLMLLGEPIIRLIFELGGRFTPEDTRITAEALLFYSIGIAAYGANYMVLRGFYATHNTLTPLLISVMMIIINAVFSFLLVKPLAHMGLGLAYSLVGICQVALMLLFLRRKIGALGLRHILRSFLRIGIACLIMGLGVWGASTLVAAVWGIEGKLAQVLQVGLSMLVGVALYFGVTAWMRMEEVDMVKNMLRRRRKRQENIN
jgi:putative peptidoglycan lipid II flippase